MIVIDNDMLLCVYMLLCVTPLCALLPSCQPHSLELCSPQGYLGVLNGYFWYTGRRVPRGKRILSRSCLRRDSRCCCLVELADSLDMLHITLEVLSCSWEYRKIRHANSSSLSSIELVLAWNSTRRVRINYEPNAS